MKMKLSLLSLIFFALTSCGFNESKYYTPSEANSSKAQVSVEMLASGRAMYINACGECHKLYKPSRNNANSWKMYLNDMQERSGISDDDKRKIYLYLTSEITE